MTFKANLKAACFRSCLTAMPKLPVCDVQVHRTTVESCREGNRHHGAIKPNKSHERYQLSAIFHCKLADKPHLWSIKETIPCKAGGSLKLHQSKVIPLIPTTLAIGVTSPNPQKIEPNCRVISLGSKTRSFFNKSTSRPGVQL